MRYVQAGLIIFIRPITDERKKGKRIHRKKTSTIFSMGSCIRRQAGMRIGKRRAGYQDVFLNHGLF